MTRTVITESMRIGGKKVSADGVVPVHYPFTNEIIGTVPAGRAEQRRGPLKLPRLQAETHALRAPADSVQDG